MRDMRNSSNGYTGDWLDCGAVILSRETHIPHPGERNEVALPQLRIRDSASNLSQH